MEELKYIRTEENLIVFFPKELDHYKLGALKPVSAGFCRIRKERVDCYGESFSLNMKSNPVVDSIKATEIMFGFNAALKLL